MKAIVNLYIYSSLHIAICAICLLLSSYQLLGLSPDFFYVGFIGASTMLLYSIHRIVGIKIVDTSRLENRFVLIRKYRKHLVVYAIIAAVTATISAFNMDWATYWHIIIPCLLSALYVLPIFNKKRRLRDIDYVKIFLVALCWAWLCGFIPAQDAGLQPTEASLFVLEKMLFIFAITLPFDFRDTYVDEQSGVKTLSHFFGSNIKYAVMFSFGAASFCVVLNSAYSDSEKALVIITYLLLDTITRYSMNRKHDFFYSGVIDGTMILFYLASLLSTDIDSYLGL